MQTPHHASTATRITSIGLALMLAAMLAATAAPAAAQGDDLDAQGKALVEQFISVLQDSDAERVESMGDFLAEEFQIVRATGTTHDKAEYIASPPTVVEVTISDVHATASDGIIVVSYVLAFEGSLDGVEQTTLAPRLSVFRLGEDGQWQISAHANFGALAEAS